MHLIPSDNYRFFNLKGLKEVDEYEYDVNWMKIINLILVIQIIFLSLFHNVEISLKS